MKRWLPVLCTLGPIIAFPAFAMPTVSLSWGTCNPPQPIGTEGQSTTLYVTVTGVDGTFDAYDMRLWVIPVSAYGSLPDNWRFDEGGCQGPSALFIAADQGDRFCPGLAQTTLTTSFLAEYGAAGDPPMSLGLEIQSTGPSIQAHAGALYTIWRITFDESRDTCGPTSGTKCGGACLPLCLVIPRATLFANGQATPLTSLYGTYGWNALTVWDPQSGCDWPDPTLPSTWGRIKATYH